MSDTWQYKVQTYKLGWKGFAYDKLEEDLNRLGQDGWDVVGTLVPSYGSGQAVEMAVIAKKLG